MYVELKQCNEAGCLSPDELCERTYLLVRNRIQGRVRNWHTAEDLTQDTMFKVWEKWPPLKRTFSSQKAWVLTIADNIVRSHWRRVRSQEEVVRKLGDTLLAHFDDGQDEAIRVDQAFDQLSPKQQLLLRMRMEGMSNKEIADQVGKTEAATAMAILRAIQKLKEILAD